ncbi:hypothetical protein PHJA_000325900 [Phtheirospermum japonicum]|uniref:Uncharacterized protein n=1 Tax=Phtheirospermum japonicum TaxID=374723 RepID=A0A830B4M5_9LAMI|nr:hypothetical protein PHJA_000325900 [Phtheirospermum japonicum]
MYANMCGFYLLALPLGVVLAFKMGMGLGGLLVGFLGGVVACLAIILVFVARINWEDEVDKAQILTSCDHEQNEDDEDNRRKEKPLDVVAL